VNSNNGEINIAKPLVLSTKKDGAQLDLLLIGGKKSNG
jgi:hypothetical protein